MKRALNICLFGLSFYLLSFAAFVGYARLLSTDEANDKALCDAVVILTGGRGRIKNGIELAHKLGCKRILISGVNVRTNLKDIQKTQLRQTKHEGLTIDVGYTAKNTLENSKEALYWCEENSIKSVAIVTSDYHLPRAKIEFANHKNNIKISFYGVKSSKIDLQFMRKCFREFNRCLQRLVVKFL